MVTALQFKIGCRACSKFRPHAHGSVVTWGDPDAGGDSSAVQEKLRNVQQVQATLRAFAAILADGSIVTWGVPDAGGDSSAVESQLSLL